MKTISPITKSENCILVQELETSTVIKLYQDQLSIAVAKYFDNIDKIIMHKCQDTGYRFFYPLNIAGDGKFYEELQKFPWYYQEQKWEYNKAIESIKPRHKVLEIGCGNGAFLKKNKELGAEVKGIELNEKALQEGKKQGIEIIKQTIQEHGVQNKEKYDVVCAFQVLEHIAEVKKFLEAAIQALKLGGKLIISVPNNDSIIFKNNLIALNFPPHHMGLWTLNSLLKLQNYFNLKVNYVHFEPLQKYHYGYAKKIIVDKLKIKSKEKFGSFSSIVSKIGSRFEDLFINASSNYINGHSILIEYIKT